MVRVLTWNLFHGRADPAAGRPLLHEFATTLAGWSWDVALLQEVPPWWPPLLARACGADHRAALTSRNAVLPPRRAIAARRPDLLKSNGGGADAILVRPPLRITAHGVRRLRFRPERRLVHAVRVEGAAWPERAGARGARPESAPDGSRAVPGAAPGSLAGATWIGNVHGQKGAWDGGPGLVLPLADLRTALERVDAWAGGEAAAGGTAGRPGHGGPGGSAPVLLGGDLNLPRDAVEDALRGGWGRIASSGPDHVLGRGAVAAGDSWRPDRGTLSDHAALAVDVRPAGA